MATRRIAGQSIEMAGGRRLSWLGAALIFANGLLLVFSIWVFARFGSVQGAIRYASGERLAVDATTKTIGVAGPGQEVDVVFLLTNRGSEPIRVVGSKSGCICMVTDDLPFRLGPGRSRPFRATIHAPKEPQGLDLSLILYTNIPSQPELELSIVGAVEARVGSGIDG